MRLALLEVFGRREGRLLVFESNTVASLLQALAGAHAGDVILLAAGNYGAIKIDGVNIAGQVVIASADESAPAVIGSLEVYRSQGLTFSELAIKSVTPGVAGAYVFGSSNIRFEAMDVHGTLDGVVSANDGGGIAVRDSSNVTITGSEFHELSSAISHQNINGLTITDNRVHDIRTDGVNGTGSSNVLISNNRFSDFHAQSTDHPDVIQMWTSAAGPSANITITGNVFVRGAGSWVQGVFMSDAGATGYQNV